MMNNIIQCGILFSKSDIIWPLILILTESPNHGWTETMKCPSDHVLSASHFD
jgi:hypothetical protein